MKIRYLRLYHTIRLLQGKSRKFKQTKENNIISTQGAINCMLYLIPFGNYNPQADPAKIPYEMRIKKTDRDTDSKYVYVYVYE